VSEGSRQAKDLLGDELHSRIGLRISIRLSVGLLNVDTYKLKIKIKINAGGREGVGRFTGLPLVDT
jgi:hypothetical protein